MAASKRIGDLPRRLTDEGVQSSETALATAPLYYYLGLNHVRKIGSRDATTEATSRRRQRERHRRKKESTKEKKSLEEKRRRRKQQPWKLTRSWKKAFIS